jgi:hypothetical protein
MYDVDLFDTPSSTIAALHDQGTRVVCYFSAGSHEGGRPDSSRFPRAAIGAALRIPYENESWLDTRDVTVRRIMLERMDLAVQKGCDAVDPDNMDGYSNHTGFPLTADTQLDYNTFVAEAAHARGLAIGLKNDLAQVSALLPHFDFAVVEQCLVYDECRLAAPFVSAGKPVFEVEYGSQATAATTCPQTNALGFDGLVKNQELDAWRVACR